MLAIFPWLVTVVVPWLAVNMAIAYGLSYLGGLLFGQDPKEAAEDEPRGQSFAWEPHTTMQEGIARPMCYGENQHYGNVIMRWTDVDPISGNEILFKALDYGQGPVKGVEGGVVSDSNKCLDGAPEFNILQDNYIITWWQTAGNVNDDDKTSYVGFYGREGGGHQIKGKFESIVTFASTTIDRVEYRRYWHISDARMDHEGYEKVSLYYEDAWHLIRTRNIAGEGENTDTIIIDTGGPWVGVTKVKIEVYLTARGYWFRTWREKSIVRYYLYELRAWRLEDVPVFLNGQPAHNFPEVIVRGRQGMLNQTCMLGFEKNKLEYRPQTDVVYGEPVRWTSPNNFFNDIEFTLAWLGGLYYYGSDGKIRTHSVGVKVEIRERDTPPWVTLMDVTVSANQIEQLYKAYSVNELLDALVLDPLVYGKQYDLMFTKMSGDKSAARYGDKMQLRSIREVVAVAFTHPGRALLGIIAQATERLQGDIDITWVTEDKLVSIYNNEGALTSIEYSNNRAWVDLAIRTQPVITGDGDANPWVITRFEGLDPSQIDLNFWYKWAQFCDAEVPSGVGEETEKRMPCDIICDRQTNVWSVAYEIAQIGRMHPYWRGNVLTGWIDTVTDEPIDLITMDNTMAGSWKSSYAGYGEKAGSVETFFKDAAQGYERKSRPSSNTSAGPYTRIIALEGVGVTGAAFATRVGNHTLKRNELITNINKVRMGREALRYGLGRVVRIQCNVPGWGQGYRVVVSPTDDTCELDRVIEDVSPGDLFWVKTVHADTCVVGLNCYTVDSVAGRVVTITTTWAAGRTPLKNHFTAIGVDGDVVERRIIEIEAEEDNYFDVVFETYDTDLFGSDETDPLLTNPDYVRPVTELVPLVTSQMVLDMIALAAAPLPRVVKPQLSNCAWEGDEVDTVEWKKRNPDEPILLTWEGNTYEIDPGSTILEYIYWDSEDPEKFQETATAATALAGGMYLACTNKAGFEFPTDMLQTQHGAVIQVGTITAALAQIADATISTAKIIDLAVSTGKISGLAVTTAKIGALAVTAAKIGALAVEEAKIANLAVTAGKIKDLAVTTAKIDALAVTAAKIGALAVETAKIKDLAVETLKINNLAVTTEKLDDQAVINELTDYDHLELAVSALGPGTTIGGPLTITTSAAGKVKLTVTTIYVADVAEADDAFWAFFRCEGAVIESEGTTAVWAVPGWPLVYTKTFLHEPGAGEWEYEVRGHCTDGNTAVWHRFFSVQEIKK